jgi:N-acetylglucosaminyl-diphospho-decaprenol L-rhamnosyltransferase
MSQCAMILVHMEDISTAPRVTALVVSRNCAEDLRRCLAGLESTVPRNMLEILVVDNGSRDESATMDSEFPSAQFLRMPKNFGITKALNIGLRTAKGEYIFFLPPQFVVGPDTVAKLVERLEARPEAAAVCPRVDRWYALPTADVLAATWKTGVFSGARTVDEGEEEVPVEFPRGAPILVRRSFVAGMNYFDDRFGEFGPYLELCWQIRGAGKKILVLPQVQVNGTVEEQTSQETAYVADRAIGSAVYVGKHFGTWPGIAFRIKAALSSLAGLNFGLFGAIAGGQKIDGNQAGG